MSSSLLDQVADALSSAEHRIVRALVGVTICLAAAHLAFVAILAAVGRDRLHSAGLLAALDQLNLDAEANLSTYFSCAILAFAGGLLLLTAHRVRNMCGPMPRHWLVLSWLFFAMSLDEFTSIHERFGEFLKLHYHAPGHGALHFTWVVFGLPFAAIVGCLYLPFLLAQRRRLRNGMFFAGIVYLSGALGMELIDGWYLDRHSENTIYYLLTMVEEVLEMAGVILLIRVLLRYGPRAGRAKTQKWPTAESIQPWAHSSS